MIEEAEKTTALRLSDLRPGDSGRITFIGSGDERKLQKLVAMSILPGMPVKLIQRFPAYVFEVGHTVVAVDEDIARDIYVERQQLA